MTYPVVAAGTSGGTSLLEQVSTFLFLEADLIDYQQWLAWGELFTPDGIYWVPSSPDQVDPLSHVSLIYDPPLLRQIRLQRYCNRDASSLERGLQSTHHVSNVVIASVGDSGECCTVRSRLVVGQWTPSRSDTFHARCTYELEFAGDGGFRIMAKRVDLLGAGGALGDILTLL